MTKHHYIPQFYLRPWLGEDNKLTEFRRIHHPRQPLPKLDVRRRGTNETGYEENLYTLRGTTRETRENVERIFMGAVDASAALARDLLLQDTIPQDPETRHAWARFILSLLIRTPETIADYKAHVRLFFDNPDEEFRAQYEQLRLERHPPTLQEFLQGEGRAFQDRSAIITATRLMQNENVLRTLMQARWWVVQTDRTKPFMTCDHPVVMTNGLRRPDGHFALSISPTRLFIAFTGDGITEKLQRMNPRKLVRTANEAIIGQGRRSVYAVDDSQLRDVKRFMGKRDYFRPRPELTPVG